MPSPDTIDFERLLAPINDGAPTGEDLRAAGAAEYYALKDACRQARRQERPHSGGADPDSDDHAAVGDASGIWRDVLGQAQDLLATRAKDIELAAWLTEALVRLYGFAGLRDGFRYARELIETFANDCYPRGEDGAAFDPYPLKGLNGEEVEGVLLAPLRNVPITQGSSIGPFASWHYQQAKSGSGDVALEDIDLARGESDPAFLRTTAQDLVGAVEEFDGLARAVDALCGADALPTSFIRNQLTSCQEALKVDPDEELVDGQESTAADEREPSGEPAGDAGELAPTGVAASQATLTREEAFRTIAKLAAYFRRTEPHSPVSYALERIVRWGRTPLPELLEELVDEEQTRASIFRLAGINKDSGSQTDES